MNLNTSSSISHSTSTPIRVRFAPSPTGFLHIGGVRAALFNWLFAKQNQGKFLLRIEDTDLERSEENFTHDIFKSLKWLGLDWDEEPIYQSQRLDTYLHKAEELIEKGFAYRCYCTEEEVEAMREVAMKKGDRPQYNRHCRKIKNQTKDKPHVIRAKIPLEGFIEFEDQIRGNIRISNTDIDDFVLIRSNGAPTYNLSVVVDDVASQITHILRGDDHINNTPKQMHLYQFFNYPIPLFGHLPMILGQDKKKLSKRHGAVSTNLYRAEGYLPEALLNFLARLGWSHGDQEIFSIEEMIRLFSLGHVQKSSGVFNLEKLVWLNGQHIRSSNADRLLKIIAEDFSHHFSKEALERLQTEKGLKLVQLIQPKVKLLQEMAEQLVPLCTPGVVEVDSSELKCEKDSSLKKATQAAIQHFIQILTKKFEAVPFAHSEENNKTLITWGKSPSLHTIGITPEEVDQTLRQLGEQHGIKLGDLVQPLRLWITGRMVSASLFELIVVLPWDVTKARLEKAFMQLSSSD